MFKNQRLLGVVVLLSGMMYPAVVFAQPTAGTVLKEQMDLQKEKKIEQTIKTPQARPAPEVQPVAGAEGGQTVLIKNITVEGNTLLPQADIEQAVAPYRNRSLTIDQIRKLTADITNLYRSKGFVTSRAYLPQQTIESGNLIIRIIEGKWGELTVKGNHYFSTGLIRSRIAMKQGGVFDYNDFLRSIQYINEHPDRFVRASLVPGKVQGTTDVVLDVKERAPFHVGAEYDNWASRELDRYRYTLKAEHNNLTGHDDRLYLAGRVSDHDSLITEEGRYLYPLSNDLAVGVNAYHSRTDIGHAFETLDMHGQATVLGAFLTDQIIRSDNVQMRGNLAFDVKDAKDYSFGEVSSRDKVRVLRTGMEWDVTDHFGRNILDAESDIGIPDVLGAMDKKDPMASRSGAGSVFSKGVFSYYRLQPMPFESQILLKNNAQFTNNDLVAMEQFQIGGPTSVRAYAPAERSADSGYYSSVEWTFPLYGLSRTAKVPGRNATFYDSLRVVTFYDAGEVVSNNTSDIDKDRYALHGYGYGIRFNPDNDLAVRIETGFPIGDKSSDGKGPHTWFQIQFLY